MRCQLVMLAGIPEGMRTVLFLSVYHASGENLALRLLMAEEDWAEEGGPKDIRHRNESGWHRPVKAPPPVVVAMQLGLVWHELYDTALSPPPPLPCPVTSRARIALGAPVMTSNGAGWTPGTRFFPNAASGWPVPSGSACARPAP